MMHKTTRSLLLGRQFIPGQIISPSILVPCLTAALQCLRQISFSLSATQSFFLSEHAGDQTWDVLHAKHAHSFTELCPFHYSRLPSCKEVGVVLAICYLAFAYIFWVLLPTMLKCLKEFNCLALAQLSSFSSVSGNTTS